MARDNHTRTSYRVTDIVRTIAEMARDNHAH